MSLQDNEEMTFRLAANWNSLLVADRRYLDGLQLQTPQGTRYDGETYTQPKYTNPDDLNERLYFSDYLDAPVYRDNYVYIENDPSKQQGNYNSGFPYHGGVSYGTNLGTVRHFNPRWNGWRWKMLTLNSS